MLRIDRTAPPYLVGPEITLGEFERRIMGESYEVVGVFGEDERLILVPKQGVADLVSFIEEESPYLVDAILTHNHPTGSVFSYDDAVLVVDQDVVELRAVCPDGTVYVLQKPASGWPMVDPMLAVIEHSLDRLLNENEHHRRVGASILKGRERDALMFSEQRRRFAEIGVQMRRTDVWRR